jgi:predicted porin
MKKIIFAFSFPCFLAGTASAQSSVTLYGIVAGNVTYANNVQIGATSSSGKPIGGAQVAQLDGSSSGLGTSRWGVKGTEDLGSGINAIFQLESGLTINNGTLGQGGTEFGRQAWVGFSESRYGRLTLGRQGDTSVEFVSPLLYAFSWGNLAIRPDDYDNLNFTHRINNSIKYLSASYSGLRFGALYSLGGVAGSPGKNQVWSAGTSYNGAVFSFAASVISAVNPNNSLYGTNANASATGNNFGSAGSATTAESNPAIAGFASAERQQTISVATTYTAGVVIFGANYSNTQFRGLGSVAAVNTLSYSGSTTLSTAGINLRYQATPFLRFGTSFDYTYGGSVGDKSGAKYEQWNLGAAYSLSKATDLYLTGAFQHATGIDSLGRPAVAQIGYLSPSSSDKQVAFSAGIKHLF